MVYECFKGTPDAINNQILETYSYHKQEYPCPVSFKIERNIPLKFVRSLRQLLGLIGKQRNYYRDIVKDSLRSLDYFQRLKTFVSLDLTKVFAMEEKDDQKIYDIKAITFQMAQTVAQADGIELYSKKAVVDYDNRLKPFMYRDYEYLKDSQNLSILNEYRDKLEIILSSCKCQMNGNFCIFYHEKGVKLNSFTKQCRGMVIEMGKERCVGYPFNEIPEINRKELKDESLVGIPFKDFDYHYNNFFLCFEDNEKYYFTKYDSFDVLEKKFFDIKKLFMFKSNFYYIFSCFNEKIYLIGMRHKHSFLFASFQELEKVSQDLDLNFLKYDKINLESDQEFLINIKGQLYKLK